MEEDLEFIETMFKAVVLLVTIPIWLPALLALKLFKKLRG